MVTREGLGPRREKAISVLHGCSSVGRNLSGSGLMGKQMSGQPTLHSREGKKGGSHMVSAPVVQPAGTPWEMREGQGA